MKIRVILQSLFGAIVLATPLARAEEPRTVTFPAADGMLITADYYGLRAGEHPFVILLHDARSDRTSLSGLARCLSEARFAVLAIDLRGHGDSATTETRRAVREQSPAVFRDMQHDLRGAYDWLAAQPGIDRARFGLIGVGVGASIAFQYAAKDRSADVVIGLMPQLNPLGMDSRGDLGQVKGRKVLLFGLPSGRDALYSLRESGDHVQVHLLDVAATQPHLLVSDDDLSRRALIEFLEKGVGPPSSKIVYGSIESHIYHDADSGWVRRITPTNLRFFSSPEEAERRGVRASRSAGPRDDGRPPPARARSSGQGGGRSTGSDR